MLGDKCAADRTDSFRVYFLPYLTSSRTPA